MEGTVTAIEPQAGRGGRRVNVFVDGRYAFSLERGQAEFLRVGQSLSDFKAAELLLDDAKARAMQAALAILSSRPRSEREVRERLRRKQIPPPIVDSTIEHLKHLDYLNDEQFARYWVEQRQTHRPRGARLLRLELQSKGVASETTGRAIQESVAAEDPVESARRAALRKARSLRTLNERDFKRRLSQFLSRRGFDFETVRVVCGRLWQEGRPG